MIQDVMMKPVHDITWHCHRWPESDPTPPTNQEVRYSAMSDQLSCPQRSHLKQSKATSKTEYTNTQQGLSDYGYT